MYRGKWTTINENGEMEELNPKPLPYNPALEDYTDFEYSTGQIVDAVKNEAKNDLSGVGEVFQDLGNGIKNGAKLVKYVPIIALIGITVYTYKRVA